MKAKAVELHTGDQADMGRRFVRAWKAIERGERVQPVHHLTLASLDDLLATLSPRRMELLKLLHKAGAMNVRTLATNLKRDYKNVHTDVAALEATGLIERDADGLVIAPWDTVSATLKLAA